MVITVTLNPAVDKTLMLEEFEIGRVNRVSNLRYDIGGKGINVSKVLSKLGVESICTGFLGGMWEDTFKRELESRGIKHSFISISGDTRTNTKIVDTKNKTYTDINEAGPYISEEDLNKFIKNFKKLCNKDDVVVLSGGVSPSLSKDIYGTLIKIAKEKDALVILDAEGKLLEEGLKEKPYIIKPNEYELSLLLNKEMSSKEDIIRAAVNIKNDGVKVLVSLGEKGAIYVTEKGVYAAEGLKVPVKSTVGAGDSMVAALVYSMIKGFEDFDTLAFAEACGAASVMIEGTEACSIDEVNLLLDKAKCKVKEGL